MAERRWEPITTDESTLVAKPLFDAMVMEDIHGDRSLPNPAGTDESEWGEVFCETDDLIDQLVASEENPRWPGRQFTGYGKFKYEMLGSPVAWIADPAWTLPFSIVIDNSC